MRKRSRDTSTELDITAFMNLMVVLIPFLLIEAVFTQLSIIRLDLPSDQSTPAETSTKPFILEVLIYSDRFEIVDRQSESVLRVVKNRGETHDIRMLHYSLKNLKQIARSSNQDVRDITILCEDETPYELLISTMDAVRTMDVNVNGTMVKRDLFPEIGIGSAPPDLQRNPSVEEGGPA